MDTLREHKVSVAAIEAATAAGFTDWKLASPSGLAAHPTL
jgi:hypothetical protein